MDIKKISDLELGELLAKQIELLAVTQQNVQVLKAEMAQRKKKADEVLLKEKKPVEVTQ